MALIRDEPTGSQNQTHPPLKVGLELFQKALDKWLPCFNDSSARPAAIDPEHPAKSDDSGDSGSSGNSTKPGDKNGATRSLSAATSVWAVAGVFSFVFYYAL